MRARDARELFERRGGIWLPSSRCIGLNAQETQIHNHAVNRTEPAALTSSAGTVRNTVFLSFSALSTSHSFLC